MSRTHPFTIDDRINSVIERSRALARDQRVGQCHVNLADITSRLCLEAGCLSIADKGENEAQSSALAAVSIPHSGSTCADFSDAAIKMVQLDPLTPNWPLSDEKVIEWPSKGKKMSITGHSAQGRGETRAAHLQQPLHLRDKNVSCRPGTSDEYNEVPQNCIMGKTTQRVRNHVKNVERVATAKGVHHAGEKAKHQTNLLPKSNFQLAPLVYREVSVQTEGCEGLVVSACTDQVTTEH